MLSKQDGQPGARHDSQQGKQSQPQTDSSSNEPGVATTVAVAVSGPTRPASLYKDVPSASSGPTRPESLHKDVPSASPASGVPNLAQGVSSVDYYQLLAAAMQRAPNNVTAQARLRAGNVVESAPRPKAKETARDRKLRVVGSDRASAMQKIVLPGASGTQESSLYGQMTATLVAKSGAARAARQARVDEGEFANLAD